MALLAYPGNITLKNPREAALIYTPYPRQRHAFVVSFSAGTNDSKVPDLTFYVKNVDRPKVTPKTEELNQYNKKRHVYTGYKLEPVHIEFYDNNNGAAQQMWTKYARFHFGDFFAGSETSYEHDDVTDAVFKDDAGKGFGFTAALNGGPNGQTINDPTTARFYLGRIQIFHFHDGLYDCYRLINPRITNFEPDQLDYENSSVAMIRATFVYENLQYIQNQTITASNLQDLPVALSKLNGQTVSTTTIPDPIHADDNTASFSGVTQTPVNKLVAQSPKTALANGSIGSKGIDGRKVDIATDAVSANTTGYGTVDKKITDALLADPNRLSMNIKSPPGVASFEDINYVPPSAGVVYPSQVYNTINSQQTGTALYGYRLAQPSAPGSLGVQIPRDALVNLADTAKPPNIVGGAGTISFP